MSKRRAEKQGRKETGLEEDSAIPMSEHPQRATAAQLAQRKIRDSKSRRRPGISPGPSQPNPFATFQPSSASVNQTPSLPEPQQPQQPQQTQPPNNFNFTPTNFTAFGSQSASFPPNQPSPSPNLFSFNTQSSNSFPPPSSSNTQDQSTPTASSNTGNLFGGFQGSMFNIPPADQQATPQAQPSMFQPATPATNNQDNSDLSMRDDSVQDTQATSKPSFTFGTPTVQAAPSTVFGQTFGQPKSFPSFGSSAKDAAPNAQEQPKPAEAPKSVFAGFGPKESEPSKTPSNRFASSAPQANGLSASTAFGASASQPPSFSFSANKDNPSDAAPNIFGQSGTQVNGTASGKQPSSSKAEPSKPLFGTSSVPTSAPGFTMPSTQATGPSLGTGTAGSSNGLYTPSGNKFSTTNASSQPAKPLFNFAKASEGISAPQTAQKADDADQSTSISSKKEDSKSGDSGTAINPSGVSGPSRTSSLFSKIAQSQPDVAAAGSPDQKPMPKFTFGTQADTTSKSPEAPKKSSSIWTLNPAKAAAIQEHWASRKASNAQQNDLESFLKDKGNDTTAIKEAPKPVFQPPTSTSQLEDPFVSPAKPVSAPGTSLDLSSTSTSAGGVSKPNIFASAVQPSSLATSSQRPSEPLKFPTASATSTHVDTSNTGSEEQSGPSQRIKFSSRGPSNIPSYLDNNTRAKVDSTHRLRSLNEGLVKFLSSLDPSTNDFGQAIEYYCDARQALGKPLKFHQRASAGEKRKVDEESRENEDDRAPKRRKGLDEETISQTTVKPTASTSATDHTTSTDSPAPRSHTQLAQPQPQPLFQSSLTSSIFSRPQVSGNALGGSITAAPFVPKPVEQQTKTGQTMQSFAGFTPKVSEKRKATDLDAGDVESPDASQGEDNQRTKRAKIVDLSSGQGEEEDAESDSEEEHDEDSREEKEESQDPTYELEDDEHGNEEEDDDENDLQKAMDESRKATPSANSNVGKSLFERIEPNPDMASEEPEKESTDAPAPAEEPSPQSSSSTSTENTNSQGQYPSSFSTLGGSANSSSTSNVFSKKSTETSQSSLFSSSTSPSFGASSFGAPSFGAPAKTTSNVFGSSVFGQKLTPADSSTKPASSGESPAGTSPSSGANGVLGTGLFGSRPATPNEEAKDKARPHGTSIFDNASKFVGDHTFKEGTPIKFANSTAAPTPSVNVTAPSPKGKDKEQGTVLKPNGGLFGFDGNNTASKAMSAQQPLGVGFGFGSPSKLAPSSIFTPSITSSANTSRATSPGATATDTDSAAEGAEESKNETQVDLMQSRPGEENDDILFDLPKARAFILDQGWKHKAFGPLRILKNRETGKTRILFRTDPGSQIIINSLLVPTFEYKAVPSGKDGGSISCMIPKEDGKVESWLFKNGKLEVTKELAAVMEANKA